MKYEEIKIQIEGSAEAVSYTHLDVYKRQVEVRDYLIDRVLKEIPYSRLNGHRTDRLPNNANFSFRFIEGCLLYTSRCV